MTTLVVWPGAMSISYQAYSSTWRDVYFGNAIGASYRVYQAYGPSPYSILNRTYNLSSYAVAESYATAYGMTYAAVRYRNTGPNIRSIQWV